MNFFKVASKDIKSIFTNRFIRVSIVAIIVVPLLYTLLYLDAFWDPYGKLDKMPVAFVNLDKGTVNDGESVNYGNDLVDKLKESNELGWNFVSKEDAEEGLKGDKYYSEFIIPENFSQSIISAKEGTPKKAQIEYTSNAKKNYIASVITDNAQVKLKSELTKNIVDEYTTVVFDKLSEVKDGLVAAADGSGKLAEGLQTASDGSSKINDGVQTLKNKVDEGISKFNSNGDINKFLSDSSIENTIRIMNSAVYLKDADTSLLTNVPQLLTKDNITNLNKLNKDYSSSNIEGLLKDPLISKVPSVMTKENIANINKLMNDVNSLKSVDMNKINSFLALINYSDGLGNLMNEAGKLSVMDLTPTQNFLTEQAKSAQSFVNNANVLNTTQNNAALKMAISTNPNLNATQKAQLTVLADSYYKLVDVTKQGMLNSENVMSTQIAPQLASLKESQDKLKTQDSQAAMKAAQNALTPSNIQYIKGLMTQLNAMKADLDSNEVNFKLLQQLMAKVNDPSTEQTIQKLKILQQDVETMKPMLSEAQGLMTDENLVKLQQAPQLINNLLSMQQTLKDNGEILSLAEKALDKNNIESAKSLISAIPSMQDGISQLATGTNDLKEGLNKLYDGSKELNDKLSEGSDEITSNLKNSSSEMGTFVSEPVQVSSEAINPVKNYGTGFAPYFIPLSLWVGAIMMFFVISEETDDDLEAKSWEVVAGKYVSYAFVGVIQAVFVSIIVLTLGLSTTSVVGLFAVNILMSLAFVAINQGLIFILGQAGRLLSIVLLVLQLTSCGGAFPLETEPSFFRILNPLLPYTYGTQALREIISSTVIDKVIIIKDISILGGYLVAFLVISILLKDHADKLKHRIREKKEAII